MEPLIGASGAHFLLCFCYRSFIIIIIIIIDVVVVVII